LEAFHLATQVDINIGLSTIVLSVTKLKAPMEKH